MAKLGHAISKAGLITAYSDYAVNTSAIYLTLVVTDDGYLYTHGKFFRIFNDGATVFTGTRTNNTVALTDVNGVSLSSFDIGVYSVSASGALAASATNGSVSLIHNTSSLTANTYGATAASNTSINVLSAVTDSYGHLITGTTSYAATLNNVLTSVATTGTSGTFYPTFDNSATSQTAGLYKDTALSFIPSTGVLSSTEFDATTIRGTTIYQGGTQISSLFAPASHTSVNATGSVLGHVKLSDSYTDSTDTASTGGVAASPAAVAAAYTAAAALFTSNDAMVFCGTIGGDGTFETVNTNVIKQSITIGTTKLSGLTAYNAGWTFRVVSAGTITGIGTFEVGDIVICVSSYASAYAATDWTAVQENLSGIVTSSSSLTTGQLIIGAGSQAVSYLAAGTNGYVLQMVSGTPAWVTLSTVDTWRPISVGGTSKLSNAITSGALNFAASTGISLGYSGGTITITNTGAGSSGSLYSLSIKNSGTALSDTYNPVTAASAINFTNGLISSNTGGSNLFTIGINNSVTAVSTAALMSLTYNAYGLITGNAAVTSSDLVIGASTLGIEWEEISATGVITYTS